MNRLAKVSIVSTMLLTLLMPVLAFGQVGDPIVPPSGPTLTLDRIETLLRRIGTYLIMIAIVVAVIMIVWGGISYMVAQSDDATTAAKGRIWNGVIGAAVVLAVGLILRTLASLLTQSFFGT